jgi:hypothetical protein
MAAEDRLERYEKLKSLLNKSNRYANFLIERMEKQREEERAFRLRKEQKRRERAALKAQVWLTLFCSCFVHYSIVIYFH